MKKVWLVLVLAACILLFGTACSKSGEGSGAAGTSSSSSSATAKAPKNIKIAVAEGAANDEVAIRKRYLEEYIAPHYNVSFMFSESLNDSSALLDFVTNAADSGCQAVIDCSTQDTVGAARLATKYDMWYAYNGTMWPEIARGDYEKAIAAWGQDQQNTANLFADYIARTATETGEEGFCVLSVFAPQGNTANYTIGMAALEAIQNRYGLTFEKSLDELILSSTPTEAKNDKGVNVYIYPGRLTSENLPGLQAVLQSGKYGYLIGTTQTYTNTAVIVDEIERATGKNIKVMSPASMNETLLTAYNNKDAFGNPTLDFVTIKAASAHGAVLFAMLYNAITGHVDAVLNEGKVRRYTFSQFELSSLDMVETASKWDNPDTGTWVCDYSFVDSLLAEKNPGLTSDDIQQRIDEAMNYEAILARLGN